MSWKELDSSSTATVRPAPSSPASHSSGWPILPPTCTVRPARVSSSAMIVVVVVLPSLTRTRRSSGRGSTWKNYLHLRGQNAPAAGHGRASGCRHVRPQPGGAEDQRPALRSLQIPLSRAAARRPAPSSSPAMSPRVRRGPAPVAGGDVAPPAPASSFDQRACWQTPMPDHGHGLAAQGIRDIRTQYSFRHRLLYRLHALRREFCITG